MKRSLKYTHGNTVDNNKNIVYNGVVHDHSFGFLYCNHGIDVNDLEKTDDSVNCEKCKQMDEVIDFIANQIREHIDREVKKQIDKDISNIIKGK